ncbi:hypothetical protein GCM10023085_07730 [Actinomadura viridis]|uniref:Uncharacterized protein n=1 Tax=Actinomadura viridis TaxID=58110 RepID=A0A931DPQ8_9ACTN|nr:hypothetical protein [Actinomadura viridis]MBG6091782.1 hypothetical protein [Actinomadura viridis]
MSTSRRGLPRPLTETTPPGIAAYDLTRPAVDGTVLEPVVVFPTPAKPSAHAAAPDLERAVYTTGEELVCVARDGRPMWRSAFDAAPEQYMNGRADCAFSLDGEVVWLYRPDLAMRGHGHLDQWLAFDAATGAVLGQVELGSAGHGAHHLVHPDGEHVLLSVGQGQDGSRVYRARLEGGGITMAEYDWDGATLYDLSPDGGRMMTVRETPGSLLEELVFSAFPDGTEEIVVPSEAFGYDEETYETFFIGWTVGYLDAGTAIVSVHGERAVPEDTAADDPLDLDFYENHLVDTGSGRVLGPLAPEFLTLEGIVPLGDRSWLAPARGGGWHRHVTAVPLDGG